MKDFWKMFFASLLGNIVSYVVIIFLFIVLVVGLIIKILSFTSQAPTVKVKENSMLVINLDQEIVERASDLFSSFSTLPSLNKKQIELYTLLKTIDYASKDENIKGLLIYVSSPKAGYATLQSIRQALASFKNKGKELVAYGNGMSQKAYFIASLANKIYLAKNSNLDLKGIYLQLFFFKQALEKLNIEMQVVRHGKFKSAIEPFILEQMSKENRTQYTQMAYALWKILSDSITIAREINLENLNFFAHHLLGYQDAQILKYKLVDSLIYYTDLKPSIDAHFKNKLNYIEYKDYLTAIKEKINPSSSHKIAIIYAYGDIVSGTEYEDGSISGEYYADLIKKLAEEKEVKAIVLRVNSPGGDALASEQIWHAVKEITKNKPVVVSMGDYAASGGYYISCAAHYIVAEPSTITGSIGAFSLIPNVKNLLNRKLGINIDEIKTHDHSDFISVSKPLSSFDKKVLEEEIEKIYRSFLAAVADGRKLSIEQADSLAQGRIWTGFDALKLNLVDTFGNIITAINKAAQLAQIDQYTIVEYPKKTSTIEKILENFHQEISMMKVENQIQKFIKRYHSSDKPLWLTRIPYVIVLN